MKILTILGLILFLVGCGAQSTFVNVNIDTTTGDAPVVEELPRAPQSSEPPADPEPVVIEPVTQPQRVEIPAKLDLGAPFVSQAPLRNWEMPYQEACEEASMLSVVKHIKGGATDSQTINTDILTLIDWEEKNDYKVDLTAQEVVDVLDEYFDVDAYTSTDVSTDRIKYELSQGNLVIVPLAGRLLGNPYFFQPGPIFHMIVIRGYDNRNFITNEVGTNTKGEAYKYKYDVVLNAIHDWNHEFAIDGMSEEEIEQGRKVMIIIDN